MNAATRPAIGASRSSRSRRARITQNVSTTSANAAKSAATGPSMIPFADVHREGLHDILPTRGGGSAPAGLSLFA